MVDVGLPNRLAISAYPSPSASADAMCWRSWWVNLPPGILDSLLAFDVPVPVCIYRQYIATVARLTLHSCAASLQLRPGLGSRSCVKAVVEELTSSKTQRSLHDCLKDHGKEST